MNHYIVHFDFFPAAVQDFGEDFEEAHRQMLMFEMQERRVVLLIADSVETLRKTHGNYFKSFNDLLGGVPF